MVTCMLDITTLSCKSTDNVRKQVSIKHFTMILAQLGYSQRAKDSQKSSSMSRGIYNKLKLKGDLLLGNTLSHEIVLEYVCKYKISAESGIVSMAIKDNLWRFMEGTSKQHI